MITPENTHRNTFHRFFDCWLDELKINLEQLISAANHHYDDGIDADEDDSVLRRLIDKVVRHYEHYYKVKSDSAKSDVISMFSPSWLTTLEDAFLWIAGWRPTTAIHLLYSKSGIQLESRLANDLIPVITTGSDLGDLSMNQINQVDELQRKTIREERIVSEKMAKLQESTADQQMVDLAGEISEMMRKQEEGGENWERNYERVESALEMKKDELEEVLGRADDLRIRTLKAVVEILTPIQAVYFLIAAKELHLRLHDWGLKRDAT